MTKNPVKQINPNSSLYSEVDLQVHENRVKLAAILSSIPFNQNSDSKQQKSQQNLQKPSKMKKLWTYENEKLLINLYIKNGNKWKELAQNFQNSQFFDNRRNGTFLKNKFYSRLRKGIRTVNFMVRQFFSDQWEQFQPDITFKLVNCAANKYDFSSKCPLGKKIEQFEYFPEKITHRVYMLSFFSKESAKSFIKQQAKNKSQISALIADINLISQRIEPKRSNRKKANKTEINKIELKQENAVTLHQIKIQTQEYKNNQNPLPSQQHHIQGEWSSKPFREQIAKIQIVGIDSDHSMKSDNLMIGHPEHSYQSIFVENQTNKFTTICHIQCSYRCIPPDRHIMECYDYDFKNQHLRCEYLRRSFKSEQQKNAPDPLFQSPNPTRSINHLTERLCWFFETSLNLELRVLPISDQ